MISNITEMICGHGHEQKYKYSYPRDSKKIQMSYPRAKAIDKIPAAPPLPVTSPVFFLVF